jgi:hypothetical protein
MLQDEMVVHACCTRDEMVVARGCYVVDGNFECEFYTFIRPNQEQLRKM